MNLGMIGMIGGVGAGLEKHGAFLQKQEEEDAAAARTKALEDWRMKKKQEYDIAAEDRGEDRTIRTENRTDQRGEQQKDRDFQRTQTEAPTRRDIKVGDKKAEKQADYDVEGANTDTIRNKARAEAEGKETPADKAVKDAHASYYNSAGDAATTKADKAGGAAKLDPADAQELADVKASVKEKRAMIDKGRVDGSWNDDALTPGQKKVQAELVAEQKRMNGILARNRSGGSAAPAAADPLGIRKPAPAASGTSMVGPTPKVDTGNADGPASIINAEFRKTKARLASEQDPEARARLERDVQSLQAEAKRGGFALSDTAPVAATPVAAPAPAPLATGKVPGSAAVPAVPAAATPTPATPAQPGTAEAAVQQLAGKDAAGGKAAGDYESKAQALKARVAAASAAAAPAAAPAADPVLQALGATGNNSVSSIVAQQVPALRAAADGIRAAQQQVVQAAQSQNPAGVQQATQAVSAAAAKLDSLLKDMNPPQAQAVKKALGVV